MLEAPKDPTADLEAFGGDPNHLPGVAELSTERATAPDGCPLAESVGHGAYLAPGTTSLLPSRCAALSRSSSVAGAHPSTRCAAMRG